MNDTTRQPFTLQGHDDEPDAPTLARRRERLLLILAGVFLALTNLNLMAARNLSAVEFWHFGVWLGAAIIGHTLLSRRLPIRDPFLFPLVMLLTGWGITLIDRLLPAFADRQTAWLIASLLALVAVTYAPGHLRWLRRYRYTWLIGGLFLLALTIVIGQNPSGGGPRLWLGVSDIYFQPSELLKVVLVAFLASYLSDHHVPGGLPALEPLLLMWGLCVVVLVWQRDLGTAALFFVVFVVMLYVATGRTMFIAGGAVLMLVAGVIAYFAFDVVQQRVDIWWNPWAEYEGRSFQIVQSLLAVSAGGVFGQGIGQGAPTYIPVVHSDFTYAAVAEEWGLVGTIAVTACLAILTLRAFRLAARLRMFRALLAVGIGITFATQSLLIMGGVLKLIPLTGVTLPFMSYGGSSLLMSFTMCGLLLVLSSGDE